VIERTAVPRFTEIESLKIRIPKSNRIMTEPNVGDRPVEHYEELNWKPEDPFYHPRLVRIQIPGDGSCFFNAICHGQSADYLKSQYRVKIDGKETVFPISRGRFVMNLRANLADKLADQVDPKNPNSPIYYDIISRGKLRDYVASGDGPEIKCYSLENMQKELRSGGAVDGIYLEFISNILGSDIYILDQRDHDVYMIGDETDILYKNRPSLVLLFTGNHYDLVGIRHRSGQVGTYFSADDPFISSITKRMKGRIKNGQLDPHVKIPPLPEAREREARSQNSHNVRSRERHSTPDDEQSVEDGDSRYQHSDDYPHTRHQQRQMHRQHEHSRSQQSDSRYSHPTKDPRYARSQQSDSRYSHPTKDPRYSHPTKDSRYSRSQQSDPRYSRSQQSDPRYSRSQQSDPRYSRSQQSDPRYSRSQQSDPRYSHPTKETYCSPEKSESEKPQGSYHSPQTDVQPLENTHNSIDQDQRSEKRNLRHQPSQYQDPRHQSREPASRDPRHQGREPASRDPRYQGRGTANRDPRHQGREPASRDPRTQYRDPRYQGREPASRDPRYQGRESANRDRKDPREMRPSQYEEQSDEDIALDSYV
jgi:hypothetical protein